ncbi:MAG: helix-turn-helix domain-containing protein [Butyrivibrio sp.]|nr:helix-turn-helix domain-containing protein [Butyrivibrio sp.]
MKDIGKNIRKYRTFRGVLQQKLAEDLGRSKSVISNWERGENFPDIASCMQLCKILNVTPNQLFGWEENEEYQKHQEKMSVYQAKMSALQKERTEIDHQIKKLNDLMAR